MSTPELFGNANTIATPMNPQRNVYQKYFFSQCPFISAICMNSFPIKYHNTSDTTMQRNIQTPILFSSIKKIKSAQPKPRTEKCATPFAATQTLYIRQGMQRWRTHFYRDKNCSLTDSLLSLCRNFNITLFLYKIKNYIVLPI